MPAQEAGLLLDRCGRITVKMGAGPMGVSRRSEDVRNGMNNNVQPSPAAEKRLKKLAFHQFISRIVTTLCTVDGPRFKYANITRCYCPQQPISQQPLLNKRHPKENVFSTLLKPKLQTELFC